MEVPQELEQLKNELKQYETNINDALYRLKSFRTQNYRFDVFSTYFGDIDYEMREATEKLDNAQRYLSRLLIAIGEKVERTKDFDLYPGDRIRVTIPAQEPFPAGWAEGKVISAYWYSDSGWYIEFEKDNVSYGWNTGYGYWKQDVDGGTVEKIY